VCTLVTLLSRVANLSVNISTHERQYRPLFTVTSFFLIPSLYPLRCHGLVSSYAHVKVGLLPNPSHVASEEWYISRVSAFKLSRLY